MGKSTMQPTILRKPYAALDSRHTERLAVSCRVHYVGEFSSQPHLGEGLTKDVSVSGCRIISERPVTRGTLLTLTFSLPDEFPPLTLWSAHVVWVSGCQFSVRFLQVTQENRKRLQSFIWRRISHDTVSDRRMRLRLAS